MTDASIAIAISSVSTLIVTVLKMVLDYKERRFDRSERIRVADDVKAKHEEGIQTIAKKIDDNTEISVKAFDVANNVNEKLVAIGEARVKQRGDRQTDRIEAVSVDTNKVVHKIAEDVKS